MSPHDKVRLCIQHENLLSPINFPFMQLIVIVFATVFGLTVGDAIADGDCFAGSVGVVAKGGVGV